MSTKGIFGISLLLALFYCEGCGKPASRQQQAGSAPTDQLLIGARHEIQKLESEVEDLHLEEDHLQTEQDDLRRELMDQTDALAEVDRQIQNLQAKWAQDQEVQFLVLGRRSMELGLLKSSISEQIARQKAEVEQQRLIMVQQENWGFESPDWIGSVSAYENSQLGLVQLQNQYSSVLEQEMQNQLLAESVRLRSSAPNPEEAALKQARAELQTQTRELETQTQKVNEQVQNLQKSLEAKEQSLKTARQVESEILQRIRRETFSILLDTISKRFSRV